MEISVLLKNSRFLLLLLLAVLVFGALYVFRAVMLPFAVAGLFAYLIAPLINRIATARPKSPRRWSAGPVLSRRRGRCGCW